jgi:2-polyprenyl-3-methyl-5-hydroxy-6-metoxy-1,4-benzoquinol methylase
MIPNRETFENAYSGKAPWDIDKPQQVFVAAADRVNGSILDAGCGTGENPLFFSQRGHKVTGIDFLREPIERAKKKAAERGLAATFPPAGAGAAGTAGGLAGCGFSWPF